MLKKLTVLCALMGLSLTVSAQTQSQALMSAPATETTAPVAITAPTIEKHAVKAKHHRAKMVKETVPVNINTADFKELKTIPGINKKKAEAIIQYRKDHGNFTSVEDLSKVKGFNKKVMGKVSSHLTV